MAALPRGGRVLVTGASGFVGAIVVDELRRRAFDVVPTGHSDVGARTPSGYIKADLGTREWSDTDFDAVLHLAGLAEVGPSFAAPQRYITVNSAMVTHLCEPLVAANSAARVLIVSSGAVYGGGSSAPLTEQSPLVFTSPYAVSKALVENQSSYYRARGLDTVVARPFNHIGPGQRPGFIVPDLVSKVRALPAGASLHAGNLGASRDYTDVRDVVDAYIALLTTETLEEPIYNVASGVSHDGWEILDIITSELGVPTPEVEVASTRALDPSFVVGDASRLRAETEWSPRHGLRESIRDYIAAE